MNPDTSHRLESLFESSLSPDPQSRLSAEKELLSLKQSTGFVSALFSLVLSTSARLPIRQAASVYLKNHIRLHYHPQPVNQVSLTISAEDRAFLKQHLLDGLASVPALLKPLLVPTLAAVINADYPDQWPQLLPQVVNVVRSDQPSLIECGLISLVELMRLYRWPDAQKSEERSKIVQVTFPILLQLGQTLSSRDPQRVFAPSALGPTAQVSSTTGDLLYLILKIYKTSITAHLPLFHQQNIIPWFQIFLAIAQHPLQSSPGFPLQVEDRERWGWTKAKKWAYFTLNRLYARYGSPTHLQESMIKYKSFAEKFTECFARSILQLYLEQAENYVRGLDWMSCKIICHTIVFFEESIRPKETWSMLKANVPNLLSTFIFPLICISAEQLEDFEHQPDHYIKSEFGEFFDDFTSNPSLISSGFLLALATSRKKSMFMSLLSFITEVCSQYPSKSSAREKDGALHAFAYLASVLKETDSLHSKVEEFFSIYVFPEFHSQHAFLRARACEVLRKFEVAGFRWSTPELLNMAYQRLMELLLGNQPLPVRVQAALTLPEISEHPQVHEALAPNIGRIMQDLLKLSNEVDLDSLTQSVRHLVSEFSNELLPFAADMAQALRQSYTRLASEIVDSRRRLGDEEDETTEEKIMVAMNILKTLQQLVVGLEGNAGVLHQVEASAIPLIIFTLKEEIADIYDEALELLDSIQFALKMITPDQWSVFDIMYQLFKSSGADFISEMFPALDNYINYGSLYFLDRPDQLDKILDIYLTTITSSTLGCSERVIACKLADSVLLCLNSRAERAIPMFLEHSMKIIQRGITTAEPMTTKALFMHALEVVLNTILQNSRLTINLLLQNSWSSDFFGEWFNRLSSFKRTHDKKLSLLAISSILLISLEEADDSILVQSSGQLLIGALSLFDELPSSIRRRYELEREYSHDSDDYDDDDDDDDSDDAVDVTSEDVSTNIEDDEDDIIDRPERLYKARDHQHQSRENLGDEVEGFPPSSLWSDEILWETPLDQVDAYQEFASVMQRVERSGHPIIDRIGGALSSEQRSKLQKVLHSAAQGGEATIRSEIQQSVQTIPLKNYHN